MLIMIVKWKIKKININKNIFLGVINENIFYIK